MFEKVWTWAGKYRTSVTSIGIRPELIPLQLAEFTHHVQTWFLHSTELTILEMAARVHHQLVWIHPFENGNGRFSRLVVDRFLIACKCPRPIWPENLNIDGEERKRYISCLKDADDGDHEPLIAYMQNFGACELSVQQAKAFPTLCSDPDSLMRALLRRSKTIPKASSP